MLTNGSTKYVAFVVGETQLFLNGEPLGSKRLIDIEELLAGYQSVSTQLFCAPTRKSSHVHQCHPA